MQIEVNLSLIPHRGLYAVNSPLVLDESSHQL